MKIKFKENYLDEDAENSDDGSREVFTAGKTYPVKSSFGKKMVKAGTAEKVEVDKNFKVENRR